MGGFSIFTILLYIFLVYRMVNKGICPYAFFMRVRGLYIDIPESEYIRMKMYALTHRMTLQMAVRRAINSYLDQNKISDKLKSESKPVDSG